MRKLQIRGSLITNYKLNMQPFSNAQMSYRASSYRLQIMIALKSESATDGQKAEACVPPSNPALHPSVEWGLS